jgi:predicted CXXCH cytochrome family protein
MGMSNRPEGSARVEGYRSASMVVRGEGGSATPTGASKVCLSCHDGTVAVGQTRTGRIAMAGKAAGGFIPLQSNKIGTDLRGSHPVSIRLKPSASLHTPERGQHVRLDPAGNVQCTSCHDPHVESAEPGVTQFLVKGSKGSGLCLSCHALVQFQPAGASHAAPGASSSAATLASGGCAACHLSHGGDGRGRLIRRDAGADDDTACLKCHDGRAAKADLLREVSKVYGHAVRGPHDAAEAPDGAAFRLPEGDPSAPRHAGCADCHEPHRATSRKTDAPMAAGALAGVWGIDASGRRVAEARFEYEVCFKCHADSANQPQARGPVLPDTVRRARIDVNLRRVFDASAASFHPVVGPGKATVVPSLKAPLTTASLVRCGDCHASDTGPGAGGSGPAGPHGSSFLHLLERNYATLDATPESPTAYALCYKCHDRQVLLSAKSSFPLHARHLTAGRATCSACHGAHGVSASAGTPINNAHLIDFDTTIVKPTQFGIRSYAARGPASGSCALTCHGKEHQDLLY